MKRLMLSFLMSFLVPGVCFSQNISVNVDGKSYQCSGSKDDPCKAEMDAFEKVYQKCRNTYDRPSCIEMAWKPDAYSKSPCFTQIKVKCLDLCKNASLTSAWCSQVGCN